MDKLPTDVGRCRRSLRLVILMHATKLAFPLLLWQRRGAIALLILSVVCSDSAFAGFQRLFVPPQTVIIGGGGGGNGSGDARSGGSSGGGNAAGRLVTLCLDEFAPQPAGMALYPLIDVGSAKVTNLRDNRTLTLADAIKEGWVQLSGQLDYHNTTIVSKTGDPYKIQVEDPVVLSEDVGYPKGDIKALVGGWWEKNGKNISPPELYGSAGALNDKLWADRKLDRKADAEALNLQGVESRRYRADELAMYRAALDEAPSNSADVAAIILPAAQPGQTSFLVFRRGNSPTVVRGNDSYSQLAALLGGPSASGPRRLAIAGSVRDLPYFSGAISAARRNFGSFYDRMAAIDALPARFLERTWINLMLAFGTQASKEIPFVISRIPSYPEMPDGFIGPLAGGGGGGSIIAPGAISNAPCRAPWKTAPSASQGIAPSLDS